MCGIVGIVSNKNSISKILKGLKALEYRGYDSVGIGYIENKKIHEIKSIGKIEKLKTKIKKNISSKIIIGHTRWATHGQPSKKNSHPFIKKNCALVHNGIIENYKDLIKKYRIDITKLKSDTDTEVIAEIFNNLLEIRENTIKIIQDVIKNIKGTYAFGLIVKKENAIYAIKKGSPLIIGINKNEISISSDTLGLPQCDNIIHLEDFDIAKINYKKYKIFNNGKIIDRKKYEYNSLISNKKGRFKHFMLKEIFYQPLAIEQTLKNYTHSTNKTLNFPKYKFNINLINNIHLTACGTAYHACMIAKYWFEELTNIQTSVDISSEYRYRKCTLGQNSIGIVVSQSGETMDTLESLKKYKNKNIINISIVNVIGSTIGRKSDYVLPTLAGAEIGVASTKAFTTQLLVLALFSIHIKNKEKINNYKYFKSLLLLPNKIKESLKSEKIIKKIIPILNNAKSIFYIGRGTMFPLAMEGALKLKEVTYKHCEGYAAGELKHGPLALIEKNIPVIALAPYNEHFEKLISNIEEIKARDGEIIIITDKKGFGLIDKKIKNIILMPDSNFLTAPLIYSIPIQLIAYHLADFIGTNIDQPRNLAKSVTVE